MLIFFHFRFTAISRLASRSMLIHIGAFGPVDRTKAPDGYKPALKEAFESFTRWRKHHKVQSSQRRFTYRGLFNDVYGSYLNAKGYNARVISDWLLHEVIRARADPGLLFDERLEPAERALKLDYL